MRALQGLFSGNFRYLKRGNVLYLRDFSSVYANKSCILSSASEISLASMWV